MKGEKNIRRADLILDGSVKFKIAGELKHRFDEGRFICFFERIGELHIWTYEELRSIIGT